VLATAAGEYPLHGQPLARAVSYADPADAADGTASNEADEPAQGNDAAQFLSGRGLY
jgi:hypothetical protein